MPESHQFLGFPGGIQLSQCFTVQMRKLLLRWRCQVAVWTLFWCRGSLARVVLALHICKWAKWFVWEWGWGQGLEAAKTTSCQSQRESHLRYVMAAGAPHPSVSLSHSRLTQPPHPVFLVASLWAVPCCITSALHVSVFYIFPLTLNSLFPLLPFSLHLLLSTFNFWLTVLCPSLLAFTFPTNLKYQAGSKQ